MGNSLKSGSETASPQDISAQQPASASCRSLVSRPHFPIRDPRSVSKSPAAPEDLYAYEVAATVDQIDLPGWEMVRGLTNHPFLKPGFLRATEISFAGQAAFWYALLRDEDGTPVACACFSRIMVDVAAVASQPFRRMVAWVRQWWPVFLNFPVLFGGTPVSTCDGQVAMTDTADCERITATLDHIARQLAAKTRTRFLCFKEFEPRMTEQLAGLQNRGYHRAIGLISWRLVGQLESFADFKRSRSRDFRYNIGRQYRKFENAGLACVTLRGGDCADHLSNADVHRLYLQVLDHASEKLECLPVDFFRQLARELPEESRFTFAYQGQRLVAFCCGVIAGDTYSLLFCGMDYAINSKLSLYFNVMYRDLEATLAPGLRVVKAGAHADEFKRRFGCKPVPLTVFVKALGPVWSRLLSYCSSWLFPPLHEPNTPVADTACEETQT